MADFQRAVSCGIVTEWEAVKNAEGGWGQPPLTCVGKSQEYWYNCRWVGPTTSDQCGQNPELRF